MTNRPILSITCSQKTQPPGSQLTLHRTNTHPRSSPCIETAPQPTQETSGMQSTVATNTQKEKKPNCPVPKTQLQQPILTQQNTNTPGTQIDGFLIHQECSGETTLATTQPEAPANYSPSCLSSQPESEGSKYLSSC